MAPARLPPTFRWLFAGVLVNRAGTFVAPFLTLYVTGERGLSTATAGAALALWGAGGLVGTGVAGGVADRVGRRVALAGTMGGAAASLVLLGAARDPWLILTAAFLGGATADGFRPPLNAMISDIVDPAERPRAFALIFWATNLGFSMAALVGGLLVAQGWWLLFAADALSCAIFAGIVIARLPETRPAAAGHDGNAGSYRDVARDRLLLALCGIGLAYGLVLFQAFATLPLAMRDDGHPPSVYGAAIAVNGLLIVLLSPLLAGPLGRRQRGHVMALALVLVGAGFGATAFAVSAAAFVATIVVWTIGEVLFAVVSIAAVADLAPVHLRGRYQAAWSAAFGTAIALGPLAGAALFDGAGEEVLWGACGAVAAAAAAVALAVSPRLSRESPRPA